MPRVRVGRDPCDCNDCSDGQIQSLDPSLRSALARQEPPPKSAVIIIDSALMVDSTGTTSLQSAHCSHLDTVARDGCCGFLASCSGDDCPELATQILRGRRGDTAPLPQRFKNAQVALITNLAEPEELSEALGCHIWHNYPPGGVKQWPQAQEVAKTIVASLGE